MDYDNPFEYWEDEGGAWDDDWEEPYCSCGLPCDECPQDCDDCDCDEQEHYTSFEF